MRLQAIAIISILISVLTAMAGCVDHADEQSVYTNVNASGWDYGDTLRLNIVPPCDTVVAGRIAIAVRHSATYDYSNLWLEVSYGDSIQPDTVDIKLADMYGNWYGTGLGLSYQTVDTLDRHINMAAPAEISVRHIMRVDKLKDIEQIGVIVVSDEGKAKTRN